MTSGTRKPPPISTSSPREITTSRPAASAARISIVAAALLLTTIGGLGAGERGEQRLRRARCATRACRPRGRIRDSSSRARSPPAASSAAGAIGARPRLVWMMTPVALITGRSEPRKRAARAAPAARSICAQPTSGSPARGPRRPPDAGPLPPTRSASTVASAPNRSFEAAHRGPLAQRFDRRNHAEIRHPQNIVPNGAYGAKACQGVVPRATLAVRSCFHVTERSEDAPARTLLALRRKTRGAHGRRTGRARSRPARHAVRPPRLAVLDHRGLSGVRRPGLFASGRPGGRRRRSIAGSATAPTCAIARATFPATR